MTGKCIHHRPGRIPCDERAIRLPLVLIARIIRVGRRVDDQFDVVRRRGFAQNLATLGEAWLFGRYGRQRQLGGGPCPQSRPAHAEPQIDAWVLGIEDEFSGPAGGDRYSIAVGAFHLELIGIEVHGELNIARVSAGGAERARQIAPSGRRIKFELVLKFGEVEAAYWRRRPVQIDERIDLQYNAFDEREYAQLAVGD